MRAAWIGLALLVAAPSVAGAQSRDRDDPFVWAVVSAELAMAASVATLFAVTDEQVSAGGSIATALIPTGVGVAAGVASSKLGWSDELPLALHGAMWSGAGMFVAGGLLEGLGRDGPRGEGRAFELGVLAPVMGGVGALIGAVTGARAVNGPDLEGTWLGPPVAGSMVGVLLAGVIALGGALNGWSDEKLGRAIGFPAVSGWLVGSAVSYGFVLHARREAEGARAAARPRAVSPRAVPPRAVPPRAIRAALAPRRGGAMITLGGAL